MLDSLKAIELDHKEIARKLKEFSLSPWWCQKITTGYEYARKGKAVGDTKIGFETGVRRTFDVDYETARQLLLSPAGRKIWLGEVPQMEFWKGEKYQTETGIFGGIRVLNQEKT